ncbi:MAG TPA: hypothetical protein VLX85_10235, partial [Stellaceae bacterium]|nr:hypothetical protein [Stellaceae bacterium]
GGGVSTTTPTTTGFVSGSVSRKLNTVEARAIAASRIAAPAQPGGAIPRTSDDGESSGVGRQATIGTGRE